MYMLVELYILVGCALDAAVSSGWGCGSVSAGE